MAIPDYQSIMLPLLKFAGDKKEHSIREAIEHISGLFNLSNEEKRELLSSGQQPIINNRTGWARTYLKKAGLLESPRKSYFKITDIGLNVLKQNPPEITNKYLEQFPGFVEFKTIKKPDVEIKSLIQYPQAEGTPRESIEENILKLQNDLGGDLIIKIKQSSPEFFERLVIDLLLKMG
ncbi:MAG TPA: winged helix-turn-helix domain-containing protein [Candidatus Methanoperedens sp.]|nr:winged helix-turn-helix domain-containing protein [Candidatus Methanoperedens sp.]